MKKLMFVLLAAMVAVGLTVGFTACKKSVDMSATGLVGTWMLQNTRYVEIEVDSKGNEKIIRDDVVVPAVAQILTLRRDGTGTSKIGVNKPFSFEWYVAGDYFIREIGGVSAGMAIEVKTELSFRISESDAETDDEGTRHEKLAQYNYVR